MRPPRPVWAAAGAPLLLLLLVDHGLGLPSPASAPAADRSGWPDMWGVLRAIRDTTAVTKTITKRNGTEAGNKTDIAASETPPQRSAGLGQVTKQVSDRMANMFMTMRSSLWQLTGSGEISTTTSAPAAAPEEDLETDASSDVLGKESADKQRDADSAPSTALQQQQQQQQQDEAQSFMSSAIERVRDAQRTFSEIGRTVGRWGKAMADSIVGSTVNSAVGTVLQVIKGGKQDDDADHVCFSALACFSMLEPWTSSKRPLPRMNSPEEIQTRFFLYTRNTSSVAEPIELLVANNDTVDNAATLLKSAKTVFVVHGFNDKTTATWLLNLKDALLAKMDANVILVDWAPGAQASRNYLQAASNTRVVGAEIARLLELLSDQGIIPMDTVHVIGHSLGAHVAGYTGKQLMGRLGRITALDAAQPAFEDQAAEVRVAVGDAIFVDAVHTNGVPFIPTLGLGVMQSVGDVDFYMNGGMAQPGCFVPKLPAVHSLIDLAALPVSVLGDMLSCSHRRAIDYFTESLRSDCRMWGRRRPEDDLDADRDGSDKKQASADSSSSGSRRGSQTSWWPPWDGLGGLFGGFFSSGDKAAPTTEAPATTGPGRPSVGFSFPLPGFLASVFSSDGRRDGAASSMSPLIVKDKAAEVRPVEGNGIGDSTKSADYPSGPGDSLTVRSSTKRSPPTSPPPPPPTWCGDDDCLPLGMDAARYNLKGTFHVRTADHAPYCIPE